MTARNKNAVSHGVSHIWEKKQQRYHLLFDFIAILMIVYAFSHGLAIVQDLEWPPSYAIFRDMGQSQSILDGRLFDDPLYLNEKTWYNPLLPSIIAATSWITKIPVRTLYTQGGAYLGLFAPLLFYMMLRFFFRSDRAVAVGGLFAFLFLLSNKLPSWIAPTYSPWLFAANFGQIFFYLTLMLYLKSLKKKNENKWSIFTGISLGFAFLSHTAPAVMAGVIILLNVLYSFVKAKRRKIANPITASGLPAFLRIMLTAFITSLPFIYPILFHYGLQIKNRNPMNWTSMFIEAKNLKSFIEINFSPLFLLFIVSIGVIYLLKSCNTDAKNRLLVFWFGICGTLFSIYFAFELMGKRHFIPRPVPTHHLLFYLKAFEAIVFGIGIVQLVKILFKVAEKHLLSSRSKPHITKLRTGIETCVLVLALIAFYITIHTKYVDRIDFKNYRERCTQFSRSSQDITLAYDWMLAHTLPSDVFLAEKSKSWKLLAPAARKTIVAMAELSNPYVDWLERSRNHDALVSHLKNEEYPQMINLLKKYDVKYIVNDFDLNKYDKSLSLFLKEVLSTYSFSIFEINYNAEKMLRPNIHPVKVSGENGLFTGAIVSGLTSDDFSERGKVFYTKYFGSINENYVNKKQHTLSAYLQRIKKGEVVIVKRKDLIGFLASQKALKLEKLNLSFCSFAAPDGILNPARKIPTKAMIFQASSKIADVFNNYSIQIFPARALKKLVDWKTPDDREFIQSTCRLMFDAGMEKKYENRTIRRLKKGKDTRNSIFDALFKQSRDIYY